MPRGWRKKDVFPGPFHVDRWELKKKMACDFCEYLKNSDSVYKTHRAHFTEYKITHTHTRTVEAPLIARLLSTNPANCAGASEQD